MSINLTPIIQAIITLLAALITYRLIPWIKARTSEKQQDNLRALIRVLVFAAEQLYGSGNGEVKMNYVCARLREHGYEVDLPEIEASVYEAFHYDAGDDTDKSDYLDGVDLNIAHWSLDQLADFCNDNGVPCEGCGTREDYIAAIEHWGRVSDEPPSSAAEGREE